MTIGLECCGYTHVIKLVASSIAFTGVQGLDNIRYWD